MTVIAVGNPAEDRAGTSANGNTLIDRNTTCDGSGIIDTLDMYVNTAGNFWVGTFKNTNGAYYRCRDAVSLGWLAVGLNTINGLNLQVALGDYIGFYSDVGKLDMTAAGQPEHYQPGNFCVPDYNMIATAYGACTFSIHALGDTVVPPVNEEDIENALTGVMTDYTPTVENWLFDNWKGWSSYDFILSFLVMLYLGQGEGGGGECEGVTLLELQGEIATLQTAIEGMFSTQTTAIIGLYNALVLEHEATRTAIGVSEGNITSNDDVNAGLIRGDIAALDFATSDELDAAALAINTNTNDGLAALAFATPTDVTNAQNAIIGDVDSKAAGVISDLSNVIGLAEAAISGLIGDLSTQVAGALADILAAIAALLFPKQYPGDDGVAWGSTVTFSGTVLVTAAESGVDGAMDGVRFQVTSVPSTKGKQTVEGVDNWKYLGWLMFLSDNGTADELQWLGPEKRAYLPKQLTSPASVIVFCRDGASGSVRPFVI